jgi:HEAT repeat protein
MDETKRIEELIAQLNSDDSKVESAAAKELEKIGEPALPALFDVMTQVNNRADQTACSIVINIGKPAIPYLLEALASKDPNLRLAATVSLGGIGDPSAIPALIGNLQDEDWIIRAKTIEALGAPRHPSVVPRIYGALFDVEFEVRRFALTSLLGILRTCKTIEGLQEFEGGLTRGDTNLNENNLNKNELQWTMKELTKLKVSIVKKKNELAQDNGIPLDDNGLFEVLKIYNRLQRYVEPDLSTASEDEKLLYEMRRDIQASPEYDTSEMSDEEKITAIPFLIECLKSNDELIRYNSGRSLVLIGKPAVLALIEALDDLRTRNLASISLGEIGDKEAARPLIKLVIGWGDFAFNAACSSAKIAKANQDDLELRELIFQVYGILESVLNDEDEADRHFLVIQAISEFAEAYPDKTELTDAVPSIIEYFKNDQNNIAKKALLKIGKNAVYSLISESVHTPNPQKWIDLLVEMGKPIVPTILELLDQESWHLNFKANCIALLGRIGDPLATPSLIKALEYPTYSIRRSAAISLGKIDITDAELNTIISLLETGKTWEVRQGALEALINIENPKSIPAICRMIGDDDLRVRKLAAQSLEKLFEKCVSLEQINDFEKEFQNGYTLLKKKSKEKLGGIHISLARLQIRVAAKRNELAKDQGILLDDKPKPPKEGKMFQRLRRLRNG